MQEALGNKQFFLTPGHACSYLPRRQAHTLFLDPRDTITLETYQLLTDQGFRRSGSHLYRPHCRSCRACVPTRVPVERFEPRRSQRRTLTRNADLTVQIHHGTFSPRFYDLYARYIAGRHADGDMYPPSKDQFRSFLLSQWADTLFLCSYLGDALVAVAVTDRQRNGLSAIYTFFDPALADRSLGVWSVLQQIELARHLDLPYLYLGYWIRDAGKMSYKIDYRPTELLIDGVWLAVD
ncbi:MAG: arginyltransferase [Pseudomonadales bacterium]